MLFTFEWKWLRTYIFFCLCLPILLDILFDSNIDLEGSALCIKNILTKFTIFLLKVPAQGIVNHSHIDPKVARFRKKIVKNF